MNKQNKKTIMQWLFVGLLIIGIYMVYRDVQSKVEQAAIAPNTEEVSSGADTSPETQGNTVAVTDATPNYDPNDPYGVKFGFSALGFLGVLIILDWALKQGVRAVSKRRGGGS